MHKINWSILIAVTLFAANVPAEDGWVNLNNGKDLSNWTQKGGNAKYRLEDNVIVGETVADTPNSFLCTKKEYGNFILQLDFQVDPRLNSGVQIRSECFDHATNVTWQGKAIAISAGRVHGYQVEIDPDVPRRRMWTAGLYDEARRLWLYPGQLGGDTNDFSKQGLQIFKTNDWNHLRVEAVGSSIKTYLNNTLCAHIEDSLTPRGFIALQVHSVGNDPSKAGMQVRFRNVQLKEVDLPPK